MKSVDFATEKLHAFLHLKTSPHFKDKTEDRIFTSLTRRFYLLGLLFMLCMTRIDFFDLKFLFLQTC